jgi:hypothetical protein
MILFDRKLYIIGHVWFDEDDDFSGVDIVRRMQSAKPPTAAKYETVTTIKVDLRDDPSNIASRFKKNTKYEIRRAENSDELGHAWVRHPDSTNIAEFIDYYNEFAAAKGLEKLTAEHLTRLSSSGALAFFVATKNGSTLVWHVYYLGRTTARLLYSASHFRSEDDAGKRGLVGRANRWLHWKDMVSLKESGISFYDFGGWYAGESDQARLQINKFKEEFAQNVITEYSFDLPVTLKGKFIMWLKRIGFKG